MQVLNMATKNKKVEKIKNSGLVSSREVQNQLNITQSALSRLVKAGEIIKLSYGLYAHPSIEIPPEDLDFAIACSKFGNKSTIGGLSALFQYGLIDQAPSQVWVIVPIDKANNNSLYRVIRTKLSFKHGIDSLKFYRMTNVERTILEALKYSEKIGPRIAIGAARSALQRGLTTEKKLGEMAKNLKLHFVLKKYWEAIVV
jgi:predicted transcriptional regulator of viral defense system